jgi:hypothetical protein
MVKVRTRGNGLSGTPGLNTLLYIAEAKEPRGFNHAC